MANGNKKKKGSKQGLFSKLAQSGILGTKAKVSATKKRKPLADAAKPKRRPKKKRG